MRANLDFFASHHGAIESQAERRADRLRHKVFHMHHDLGGSRLRRVAPHFEADDRYVSVAPLDFDKVEMTAGFGEILRAGKGAVAQYDHPVGAAALEKSMS